MPQIGPLEILVVGTIALLVFGAERLPEMARSGGRYLKRMRSYLDDIKNDFESGLDEDEEDVVVETDHREGESADSEPRTT